MRGQVKDHRRTTELGVGLFDPGDPFTSPHPSKADDDRHRSTANERRGSKESATRRCQKSSQIGHKLFAICQLNEYLSKRGGWPEREGGWRVVD